MKNAEQVKGAIKNMAVKMNLRPQEVLQIFMFERLVERLAASEYKNNFILKGRLLIASMIGIHERPIMDNEYNNFCVSICAHYGKMKVPMKIDITTGDIITPGQINYSYPFMFEEKSVMVKAYTLETILAEKYETILRRSIGNTRARVFYDLFILFKLKDKEVHWNILKEAVLATAKKRGALEEIKEYPEIVKDIQESKFLKRIWEKYQKENTYSREITFSETWKVVLQIGNILQNY